MDNIILIKAFKFKIKKKIKNYLLKLNFLRNVLIINVS